MGAPPEVLAEAAERAKKAKDFELFEDCQTSLSVFLGMQTQWVRSGMDGQITGLIYPALPIVMRAYGVPPGQRRQVFEDVQILERETLNVIKERTSK